MAEEFNFVSADISKIADFESESPEVIQEFADIMEEFGRINGELLGAWKGAGADAYKKETDHILEKIGSIDTVLNSINESVVKDIRSTYNEMDEALSEFNKNPGGGEE